MNIIIHCTPAHTVFFISGIHHNFPINHILRLWETATKDLYRPVCNPRVLVSRCLEDKNESLGLGSWSLGLEHLVLVLKKKSCSFSRLLL